MPFVLAVLFAILCAPIAAQDSAPCFANTRVLLVANGGSPFSLALAHRYAELRHLPPAHVLVLDPVPAVSGSAQPIALDACREQILRPIQAWLQQRGIADEIDAIVYSSGFPHAVDIQGLPVSKQPQIGNLASLTGLTCFLRTVVAGDMACIGLDANRYATAPGQARAPVAPAARGFGNDAEGRGKLYLSVMLAWLGPFGQSYADAVANLERSAAADATDPRGTFYFLQNGDVRATTRMPLFPTAMAALQQLGRKAALLQAGVDAQDGILPRNKGDVLGAVVGSAGFDWSQCGSSIVPGAIVEHLTSFGASFQIDGQTKLTALLQAGAAGASGTVTEPYAIAAKFPTPLLHVYYASGCSLAEAFYQSVRGPYQLLIVGDACCRPFARLAPLQLDAIAAPWSGTVTLAPRCADAAGFEAWVDGALVAVAGSDGPLRLDSTQLADGPHELQLVAIGAPPIGVPTALRRSVAIDNHGLAATLTGPGVPIELGKRMVLRGRAPEGARWQIMAGSLVLQSGSGNVRAELPSSLLGLGRSVLQLRATLGDKAVVSEAIAVETKAPVCTGVSVAPGALLPGLAIAIGSGSKLQRRGVLAFGDALPIPAQATAVVRGSLQLPAAGLHEWTCGSGGMRSLSLDGIKVVDGRRDDAALAHGIVLDLAAGWHSFELELEAGAGEAPRLSLSGQQGALPFAAATCGQGPFGLERLAADKLTTRIAAWTDGDRGKAVAPSGDAAEIDFAATKVGAVLVSFAGLGAGADVLARAVVETRDGGPWTPVRADDLRLLGPSGAADVVVLLAVVGGRRAQHLRVRAKGKETPLPALSEIEVFAGAAR